jgi:ribonuclease HI
MRNLCGTKWGASIDTLLVIYKALIKSIIEYGAIVYNNISKTNQAKLDSLQYKALKICCGTMTGAPLIALQNETGEMPIQLSRHKQQLIYYAKVKTNTKHPSQHIIHYPPNTKYIDRPNLDLLNMNTEPIFKQQQWTINSNNNIPLTPWLNNKIITNVSLIHTFKTFHTTAEKLKTSNTIINSYTNSLHIYTDGTLQQDYTSASGFYIPSINNITTTRNTNNTPILTAELIAIQHALEYTVTNTDQTNITIFTDSIESINRINQDALKLTIKASQIASNIKHLVAIHKHIKIQIVWVPSHIGIPGNEIIDQHTKTATTQQIVTNPPSDLIDIKQKIDTYITEQWQIQYNNSTKAQTYKLYEPIVNTKLKSILQVNRNLQRKITRLKIGRCCLNAYQYQNGFHVDGLCPHCNNII